ncbi:hypothetical protein HMPREF2141_02860 [Bacteroides uniformis]|jgi:hypothetical protein|nr:hypothetical protein HMPREF2141_02860 [Bacteroides uniformis]
MIFGRFTSSLPELQADIPMAVKGRNMYDKRFIIKIFYNPLAEFKKIRTIVNCNKARNSNLHSLQIIQMQEIAVY